MIYNPPTKTVCTECGSDEIYIEIPEEQKLPQTQTLDEMVEKQFALRNAIYIPTTWKCKKCGYSVTR